jgi:alkanesulfonate monooxygenase SsuD/methylene tetrahydromethanopterin reductase-like flavin-dependent oxidoreductase (luciferase family)
VPPLPQGRPVLLQAGDSDAGREFAARHADGIFSRHGRLEEGQRFYRDVKGRLAGHGRSPDELLILPGATFVLGDSDADAHELAREVRRAQVSGPHAIMFLEQLWNRDLSAYDPNGLQPEVEPDVDAEVRAQGSAQASFRTEYEGSTLREHLGLTPRAAGAPASVPANGAGHEHRPRHASHLARVRR